MSSDLDVGFSLVALAPFFAAALAPLLFRFTRAYTGWVLAIIPAAIFIYLLSFVEFIGKGGFISAGFDWVPSYGLRFSFFIDGLSLTFAMLISGIGTFIILYSGAYLKGHLHQGRFFAFMLMFMGSMLGLVLADNMITLFVFWELTAITSFLLIGFDHRRQASRRAAIQALVITGGGGLFLLAGLLMLYQITNLWELSSLFQYGPAIRELEVYPVILALVLMGAFTKSAQFPFHFWLPNAMEAPTPVSAYLHSATMVKAGIYLLARFSPILGNTTEWNVVLTTVGSVTLLWGATTALRQTDLKQMLAQTTVASLGLLVILIGMGTLGAEWAIIAAVLYLVAHAFYKGALFMVAGAIDHATGTRDITALGGLWRLMPLTFAAALVGTAGMAGAPATVAFFANEEMYVILAFDNLAELFAQPQNIIVAIVLILGNAMMMAAGLAMLFKVFFGPLKPTPLKPHEGSFSLWIGALVLGGFTLWIGTQWGYFQKFILTPTASSIYNLKVEPYLKFNLEMLTTVPFLLSALTWVLGVAIFLKIDAIRTWLREFARDLGWSFDAGFDWLMFRLVGFADRVTRFLHHGRLELYLVVVFVGFAAALLIPMWGTFTMPALGDVAAMTFYEWAVFIIAMIGLFAVITAKTRLVAIVSLGIQGFAVALFFMLFGAPDLGFTQFMVETLTVVILALVMTRLHLDQHDSREPLDLLRDGGLALAGGIGVTLLMISVLQTPLDMRLSEFFAQTSVPLAHGSNIVNVILVDYRGLDTLGEIAVVMTTGVAILALIRIRGGGPQTGVGAKNRRHEAKPKRAGKPASANRPNLPAAPRQKGRPHENGHFQNHRAHAYRYHGGILGICAVAWPQRAWRRIYWWADCSLGRGHIRHCRGR